MKIRILILALLPYFVSAQDIFKSINSDYDKVVKQIENDFYNLDFTKARIGKDLSKITLDPVKAKPNTYSSLISDRDKVVAEVNKYQGVPYLWGGSTPTAFDCSGLIQWVVKKTHGVTIPRTTAMQYDKWGKAMKKNLREAEPGDLVYFKTRGSSPVSHVGVYVGDNKFIHAPKSNDVVKTSEIKGYWLDKFVGFVDVTKIIS